MAEHPRPGSVPSPLQLIRPPRPPVVKNYEVSINRPRNNRFLEGLAKLAMVMIWIVGIVVSQSGGVAGWVAGVSVGVFLMAGVDAIIEHTKHQWLRETNRSDQDIINQALEKATKL